MMERDDDIVLQQRDRYRSALGKAEQRIADLERERDEAKYRALTLAELLREWRRTPFFEDKAAWLQWRNDLAARFEDVMHNYKPDWCYICNEPVGRGVCPRCERSA